MQPIHYAVTGDGLKIYAGSGLVMKATKDYQLIQVAKDCLTGKLLIPLSPEPIEITDHPWLLRLASDVARYAAQMVEATNEAPVSSNFDVHDNRDQRKRVGGIR